MATGYSVGQYGDMIVCEPRMSAFADALRAAVTPGCTVIDLGAGSGIFSLLACQYGAGKVIAIEPSDAIQLLPIAAKDNGCADRITVIQDISTAYSTVNAADVIISDLRGSLPLFERNIPTIMDARDRLLAPGGTLIPLRDTIRVALACYPDYASHFEEPWLRNAFGIDLSSGHRFALNRLMKLRLAPDDLRSEPQDLIELDYWTIASPDTTGSAMLTACASGTVNGFLLWFETELAPGIGYSNAPDQPKLVYEATFFPLQRPIMVTAGDRIALVATAKLSDHAYLWTWTSQVFRQDRDQAECEFRQNSFAESALAAVRIRGNLKESQWGASGVGGDA